MSGQDQSVPNPCWYPTFLMGHVDDMICKNSQAFALSGPTNGFRLKETAIRLLLFFPRLGDRGV